MITVCTERRDSVTVYHYTVRNDSPDPVIAFFIGYGSLVRNKDSTDNPDGGGELGELPLGAKAPWEDGGGGILGPMSASSPAHWNAKLTRVEETSGFILHWHVADNNKFGIAAGITQPGFTVTVPRGDSAYVTAHWTLILYAPEDVVGRLQREPGCAR